MKFTLSLLLATVATVSAAPAAPAALTPTSTLEKRADFCGQWDSYSTGAYTVYNNLWNKNAASSGSQCTGVGGLIGNTAKWHTRWSWAGSNNQVKSFANIVVALSKRAISSYSSMASNWSWTYSGSGLVADVAYDMFTSSSANGSPQYEVMVWLSAIGGAGPISSTGSPIATPHAAGKNWKLYKGQNGQMTVFSFVAPNPINDFSGGKLEQVSPQDQFGINNSCVDLKSFFDYLIASQGLPSNQVLLSIGAGTEPFVGSSAVFDTSAYSVVVK